MVIRKDGEKRAVRSNKREVRESMKARLVGRRETWKVDKKASKVMAMKGTDAECRQTLSIIRRAD
jgi:hypothetical protein